MGGPVVGMHYTPTHCPTTISTSATPHGPPCPPPPTTHHCCGHEAQGFGAHTARRACRGGWGGRKPGQGVGGQGSGGGGGGICGGVEATHVTISQCSYPVAIP